MKSIIQLALLLFVMCCPNVVWGQNNNLFIDDIKWTANGVSSTHTDKLKIKAPSDRKLQISMVLSGQAAEMEVLKATKKLPIQHKWYKYNGTRLFPMEVKVAMRISSITENPDGSWEVQCSSFISPATPGTYVVKTIFYNRESVIIKGAAADYAIVVE